MTAQPYEAFGYSERAKADGVELEYKIQGMGEPVVLIHGAIVADAFEPLLAQPNIRDRYQLISYHRRGYAGSSRPAGPVTIEEQAADAHAVIRHLGLGRVHLVGHSYGGTIALQLALNHPEVVHSLTLLEPALLSVPSGPEFGAQTVEPAFGAYRAGDKERALDIFMRGVESPHYREHIGPGLPMGAWEQALVDLDTLFQVELPALLQWEMGPDEVRRITQPVLSLTGSESTPSIRESHDAIVSWLPQAEPWVIEHATHALQLMNPEGVAQALTAFLARHPLRVSEAEYLSQTA
jgi:pimeloyl-ACP methyl ester carboxylesterase